MRALLAVLAVLAACATAPPARADAARGELLYDSICSACHGPGRFPGPAVIANGAGRPAVIQLALANVPDMIPLRRLLSTADVADIAEFLAILFGGTPPPPPAAPTIAAIEYHHAGLDHYFTTAIASEIAALDSGQVVGWTRTTGSFQAWPSVAAANGNATPVCRIYIPPESGSSHFYSASPAECAETRARFPTWDYEGDEVMAVVLADPITGACAAGTTPVYRLWNQRIDVNHRYTTDRDVRATMIGRGYRPEGYGDEGVAFCAPAAVAAGAG